MIGVFYLFWFWGFFVAVVVIFLVSTGFSLQHTGSLLQSFSSRSSWALEYLASVAAAHGLSNCSSWY